MAKEVKKENTVKKEKNKAEVKAKGNKKVIMISAACVAAVAVIICAVLLFRPATELLF